MAGPPTFPKIGAHPSVEAFRAHLGAVGPEVPVDDAIIAGAASPLAAPARAGGRVIGNRWAIHPMEGWDGTPEGGPGPLTLRRWRNFGRSGAKLIWGGEAVAVRADGRANPRQLLLDRDEAMRGLGELRAGLIEEHSARFGSTDDLLLGLQLTHSGRFSRSSEDRPTPRTAFRHPILDRRLGLADDRAVLSDGEVDALLEDFLRAARRVRELGFDFVDLKHCHGYLLHEFLGAHGRAGRYGGSFENRTRILRDLVAAVRRDVPGLEIGVRVSIFDLVPFRPDPASSRPGAPGRGVPEDLAGLIPYRFGFGVDAEDPTRPDLAEGFRFLELLRELGVRLVNVSCGSPYYTPHIQRPAAFPPSDGYLPPEDPLQGVVRQLRAVRDLKARFPDLLLVGSGLSYLQDFLPQVAQAAVREGWMDFAGIGRMVLSYPEMPADCLERGALARKRVCRTFSECTTAPRRGLVSGCYPLDPHYKALKKN